MEFYKNKKVLVTGGCGFIGSHLAEKLLNLGAIVTIIDNLERGYVINLRFLLKHNFYNIDLREKSVLFNDLVAKQDYVFHLAFKVGGVIYTNSKPYFSEIWRDGTRINLNVIDACCRSNTKLLFMSSACVYSSKLSKPIKEYESTSYQPDDAYGWSKLVGELQVKWAWENGLLDEAVIIRPFNIYGEREYYDREYGHALPVLCSKAIEYPDKPFTVHGDGTNIRCFLYVSDMVNSLLEAMKKIDFPSPINIGSKEAVSINELVKKIIKLSKKQIKIKYIKVSTTGAKRRIPNLDYAEKLLGFKSTVSLDEGLKKTYEWIKNDLIR